MANTSAKDVLEKSASSGKFRHEPTSLNLAS
jgi:hypothetical protein